MSTPAAQMMAKLGVKPQAKPQAQPPAKGGGNQATPQEEKALNAGLDLGSKLLYDDDKINAAVLQMVKAAPQKGIGDAAAMLTIKVDEQLNLPEGVIVPLGQHLIELIADLAEEAKVVQIDDAMLQAAAQELLAKLTEKYGNGEQPPTAGGGVPPPSPAQSAAPPTTEPTTPLPKGPPPPPPGLAPPVGGGSPPLPGGLLQQAQRGAP